MEGKEGVGKEEERSGRQEEGRSGTQSGSKSGRLNEMRGVLLEYMMRAKQ